MSTVKDLDLLLEDFAKNRVPGCACIVMKDGEFSGEFLRDPKLSEEDLIAKMV